jgi:hypothetical protein
LIFLAPGLFSLAGLVAVAAGPHKSPRPTPQPDPASSGGPRAVSSSARCVRIDSEGHLHYSPFLRGDTVPDFSHCGFGGGGVKLPEVATRQTLEPASGADDTARIQAALDAVARLPMGSDRTRGAVLLRRGTYRIAQSLHINDEGIVLRGEGPSEDGTVLLATGKEPRTLIEVAGEGVDKVVRKTMNPVADAYVPVGARTFTLDSAQDLSMGAAVIVFRPNRPNWLQVLGVTEPEGKKGKKGKAQPAKGNGISFDRVIARIEGRKITLDAPLGNSLDAQYGGGMVFRSQFHQRIRNVGIEDLRGDCQHKGEDDEDHARILVGLSAVENAWVRRVTAVHFASAAVSVGQGAKWVTVEDSACLDPAGRSAGDRCGFEIAGGQLTLVQRCTTRGCDHDFVTGAAEGPNVFLDCTAAQARGDSGPQKHWAVATLYDNVRIEGGDLVVAHRGNRPGWTGASQVFWNCRADTIRCDSPPTAMNWAVGCSARRRLGDGHWEFDQVPAEPPSLYRAQLRDRLGPAAVANLVGKSPGQRAEP